MLLKPRLRLGVRIASLSYAGGYDNIKSLLQIITSVVSDHRGYYGINIAYCNKLFDVNDDLFLLTGC